MLGMGPEGLCESDGGAVGARLEWKKVRKAVKSSCGKWGDC